MRGRFLTAFMVADLLAALFSTIADAQWNIFGNSQGNTPAIGTKAKVNGTIDVRLHTATDFNFAKKLQVLTVRRQRVMDQPSLLVGDYAPSPEVFGQIEDGRPWWGAQGLLLGAGPEASLGTAWHSVGICNPFALVLADLSNDYTFSTNRFPTKLDFVKSGYPSRCFADRLMWNPRLAKATATYNITSQLSRQNSYVRVPVVLSNLALSFQAYNARDFGFNYCAIDSSQSTNVSGPQNKIVQIVQYFHCGTSCGIPGGCNNMSPKIPDLENFSITRLPAKCQVLLWKDKPASVSQAPDFTYLIEFR